MAKAEGGLLPPPASRALAGWPLPYCQKTGGLYIWIYWFGHQRTVDAFIAEYARAYRAGRSGHYFHEALVSGGYLLCVWALAECRKIGFAWETDSGERIRTLQTGGGGRWGDAAAHAGVRRTDVGKRRGH